MLKKNAKYFFAKVKQKRMSAPYIYVKENGEKEA